MTETTYTYTLTDFPNQKFNADSLLDELEVSSISSLVSYITTNYQGCDIICTDELTEQQETILDGVIANHQGNPPTVLRWKASSVMVTDEKDVTENDNWQDIGGAVTNLKAFVLDVSKAWGRCVGQVKMIGTGAQLRVIRESDGTACMQSPYAVQVSDIWTIVQFWANTNQPDYSDRFVLQGRLNGATALHIRDVAISILEKVG